MQNIKENSLEKNKKTSRSKDKKQNDESFNNFLKSDISDSFDDSNSFMSVKAIGVRMAKLRHKLKYTNVLAPSLKDLPDYCPSNPTYSFKVDTNKNNIHKYDINKKPSTSSSDNQIIFENYTNKSINITNNNKNKANSKKRKGDNVKKTTKKSKKLKKESLSNETVLKTNNENQTKEIKENNNIINPEIKTLTNSTEKINIIKNEDEVLSSSTIDSKMINGLLEQEVKNFSAFVDNTTHKSKEGDQEINLNKKEINHKKIKLSSENNFIENTMNTTTNISNKTIASNEGINKTNLNNTLQMNTIQNSINNSNIMVSPVLFNKGLPFLNAGIYNVNINNLNQQNSLSCIGPMYNNNKNTNTTNNIVNDNVLNKIYTKKSKIQQPQIKSQSTPLSTSVTYLNRNVVSPQSYPQGYNCKFKGDLYQVKSQPTTQLLTQQLSSINQSSPQSQNALSIREGYIKQQQQQFESQKINRLLQTRRHHQYLYVTNGSQRYGSYPAPSSQQQYYYPQTKSSSYPGITNSNIIPNLSPTEMNVNSALVNTINSTVNASKSNNFSQKQYPKQAALNNFVNLPMNNNSPLNMNSINYMSTSSSLSPLNLSTSNINTNANERNFTLISPVLQNRAVLYPTTVVQSPNEKGIVASTPILPSQGGDISNNDIISNSNTMYQSSNTIISQSSESISSLENKSLKDNNKISQNPNINYNSMLINNDSTSNNNLILAESNFVKIVDDEANNNTMVDRNILTLSNNTFDSLNENSTLNNPIENSQIISDEAASLKNDSTSSSLISKTLCEDNKNLLEVSDSVLLTEKTLKVEEGSNSTIVNQANELNSNSDINLSMVDNEKTINNDITFLSSTPYLNNKDTISTIYTPSLSTKDNFNENSNILYENITPPFSTKVSPLVLTKSELSSDELTNSLNKIKSSSINEYINSPYIVSSVPSNTSISLIEDDKEILKEKNYSITLGDNNELIQSGNLNDVSTSDPTPLELLNLNNSSKNETIGGISPITTHPTIFKQNGNEFYTMPLTMNGTGLPSVTTVQSPQYKSTVALPLTPISSRSISSSFS